MTWVAAAIFGGAVIGAGASMYAGDKSADAQKSAANSSIGEQARQYNNSMRMYEPSRQLGYGALNDIASLYGYPLPAYQSADQLLGYSSPVLGVANRIRGMNGLQPQGPPVQPNPANPMLGGRNESAPGNMSRFFTSPDYNFRRTEGTRGLEQSAAARGGAFSGDSLKDLTNFNSGLASGEFGNYMNRLFNIAGMGQTATGQSAAAGQNYANQYSNAQQNIGDARASGVVTGVGGAMSALNSGINNYMLYRGGYFNQPSAPPSAYSAYGPYASGYRFPG